MRRHNNTTSIPGDSTQLCVKGIIFVTYRCCLFGEGWLSCEGYVRLQRSQLEMYHTKTSFSSGWAALGWAELGSVTLQTFITREFLDKNYSGLEDI